MGGVAASLAAPRWRALRKPVTMSLFYARDVFVWQPGKIMSGQRRCNTLPQSVIDNPSGVINLHCCRSVMEAYCLTRSYHDSPYLAIEVASRHGYPLGTDSIFSPRLEPRR